MIRPDVVTSPQSDPDLVLRRFERDAPATASLRSPHTVQQYDFGETEDGTLFYVMELLLGIDLESLVAKTRANDRPRTPGADVLIARGNARPCARCAHGESGDQLILREGGARSDHWDGTGIRLSDDAVRPPFPR